MLSGFKKRSLPHKFLRKHIVHITAKIYVQHSNFVQTVCSVSHTKKSSSPAVSEEKVDEVKMCASRSQQQDSTCPHLHADVQELLNDRFPGQ